MNTIPASKRSFPFFYFIHAATIFVSAFLVFQIQPMISKSLLPWFGGSSSVWTTSLLFFTTSLFVGYLYVYLISKRSIRFQTIAHLVLLGITVALVISSLITRNTLTISLDWTTTSSTDPSLLVLIALAGSVGLPYVALSATCPLIQHWFSTSTSKEPYKLYAISNAGSFLALLTYPFIFERLATLKFQQIMWGISFVVFTILCTLIAVKTLSADNKSKSETSVSNADRKKYPWIRWIGYTAFPSFMLVAITATLTQTIAPIPLLWIIPLGVYLLTFVVAFSGIGNGPFSLVFFGAAIAASYNVLLGNYKVLGIVGILTALLFCVGVVFHAKVYELRPDHDQSSIFYLFTALGGTIGTLIGSILPPLIFKDVYELSIGLLISTVFILVSANSLLSSKNYSTLKIYSFRSVAVILILISFLQVLPKKSVNEVYASRTFYGVNEVLQDEERTILVNNNINHGAQFRDPKREFIPTLYYARSTGFGMTMDAARKRSSDEGLAVGIVGLGGAATASYCTSKDKFTFFDIDPEVEKIARKYFTYLDNCKNSSVDIGDGRILIDKIPTNKVELKFDVLALDAFSGDSVPTHLLTKEALSMYAKHLKHKDSLIVFNVTNTYLDLKGVVSAVAKANGFNSLVIENGKESRNLTTVSTWVVLSKDPEILKSSSFKDIIPNSKIRTSDAWTDEKTNILSVLK